MLLLLICLFTPPADWQPSKPKELSNYVQIGFVGKGTGHLNPSINLAIESVDCDLKTYLKAAKAVHTKPNTTWRDLGKIEMKAGTGQLTEIRSGDTVILQAIFLQNKAAHILTSALSKKDLPTFQKKILAAFRSLEFVDHLLPSGYSDKESLHQLVEENASKGAYWQYLALKEGYEYLDSH